MPEQKRLRIGLAGVGIGFALLIVGVLMAHFTGLPEINDSGQDIYPRIPRCLPFEDAGACWVLPTIGQLIGFIGSQILLASIIYAWILGRPLTRAGAAVGAMILTLELIILFGIIPNQWLTLTGDTLDLGAIGMVAAVGYGAVMLGAITIGAYMLQEPAEQQATDRPSPPKLSHYGRTLVKGER